MKICVSYRIQIGMAFFEFGKEFQKHADGNVKLVFSRASDVMRPEIVTPILSAFCWSVEWLKKFGTIVFEII